MPHPSILRCAEALTRLLPDFEAMRKAPPASDAVIDALETKLGQPLPADVADWLRVVNGSKDHYGFCLSAACDFLSADEIAMYWGFFADPLHSITQTFQHTDHPHRVRAPAAPGTRIPVAHHSALASTAGWLVIDVAPVHPQHRGQVLFCPRDPERSVFVVFERFTDLLDAVTEAIATGDMKVTDGVYSTKSAQLQKYARRFRDPPWAPSAADRAFAAGLTAEQNYACVGGHPDIDGDLKSEDLDLVRAVNLFPDMIAAGVDWLSGLPFLDTVTVNGDATAATFAVLARLNLVSLHLGCASVAGYDGVDALARHPTLEFLSADSASQAAFDVFASCRALAQLSVSGAEVKELSAIANLPQLRQLTLNLKGKAVLDVLASCSALTLLSVTAGDVSDLSVIAGLPQLRQLGLSFTGKPDISPVWRNPTLTNFSLSWRKPRSGA